MLVFSVGKKENDYYHGTVHPAPLTEGPGHCIWPPALDLSLKSSPLDFASGLSICWVSLGKLLNLHHVAVGIK